MNLDRSKPFGMKKYTYKTSYKKLLADTLTPVGIYLKIRDKFPNSILLESSDYHATDNSFSFICFQPSIGFIADNHEIKFFYPDQEAETIKIVDKNTTPDSIQKFCSDFDIKGPKLPMLSSGFFGYTSYNSVKYFEDIEINATVDEDRKIPDMQYFFYDFVIAINHFNDELYIFHNQLESKKDISVEEIENVVSIISNRNFPTFDFKKIGEETSNFTDEEFLEVLQKGKEHCFRGDVFQIVLSRRFSQKFKGDEFNVYRALRSVNPSPYLFYFDYGTFKIFGSSPEAQLIINFNQSVINPIAGTFRRTGNDIEDAKLAEKLKEDPKENAEHIMLVDLARNDLSRNGHNVHVETYKEVQYYSHVIHLVSKVVAEINEDANKFKIIADTFPAGTLSGAPKHMAMTLIDQYEKGNRGYYGGCIGYMDFLGNFNQAIMIRSFLSKNNQLHLQAGAGVVAESKIESELQEVHNKLAALKHALEVASTIG